MNNQTEVSKSSFCMVPSRVTLVKMVFDGSWYLVAFAGSARAPGWDSSREFEGVGEAWKRTRRRLHASLPCCGTLLAGVCMQGAVQRFERRLRAAWEAGVRATLRAVVDKATYTRGMEGVAAKWRQTSLSTCVFVERLEVDFSCDAGGDHGTAC